MKALLLLACVIGSVFAAPRLQLIEVEYKPALLAPQQLQAQGAGAVRSASPLPAEVEILLGLGAQQPQAPMFPARGFIKQEIPQPPGRESIEILYPFGFAPPAAPAPVAPVAPVAPAVPVKGDDDDAEDD